jgi:flagellar basal-body rod protein FlgC
MYGSLDISTSGMIAQRIRHEVAAANIANKDAILDSSNQVNPYRARRAMFAPGNPAAKTDSGRALGVHVAEIAINQGPPIYKFEPDSPYAFKSGPHAGTVPYPDINTMVETVNGMEAVRAYEANVMAAETTKAMMAQALRLIA